MAEDQERVFKLPEFAAHAQTINCLALGHKSSVLVTGGEDRKINLWTLCKDGYTAIMSLFGHVSPIEAVRFDHSEEKVATGTRSGTFKVWDLETLKVQKTFYGHRSGIKSIAFHPTGDFIASASTDSSIKLWDIKRKSCIYRYKGHQGSVNNLQFSPDGGWIASAGDDGIVKLWDLKAGKLLADLKGHKSGVNVVDFHPGELLLASGSSDRTVKFWDLENFHLVSSTPEISHGVDNILFHPSGSCLFATSANMLRVYGWEPYQCFDEIRTNWGNAASICFTNTQLLAASYMETFVFPYLVFLQRVKPIMDTCYGNDPKSISSPALDRKKPFSHGTPDTAAVMPHRRESNSSAFELEHRNIDHNHQAANLPRTHFQNNLGEISDQKCNNIISNNREHLKPQSKISPKLLGGGELEAEIFNQIEKGHSAVIEKLHERSANLMKIEDKWKYDNARAALKLCIDLGDPALVIDMLSVMNSKKDLWNLDLCTLLSPKLVDLITSPHKRYVETVCGTLKLILETFGPLLKSCLNPSAGIGVDITAEERMNKCEVINGNLDQIKVILDKMQVTGQLDDGLKEVQILVETL
ncbi:katanin p80 WD40 repeat-containing subunit B1 [Octopus vulgaris]|uniref:Katanin p80 WD40 repeat-containing subunit B1 n=2 Tax=Octopus TaxID=6643 RepID=A0AA36F028_OCTVU|nr:katanin p80 WD40 repeat-containing subunit B1 [Octopus sinensis]CAI9720666.1 katanin p80 WD40 repeat-containing subunit B1 [Octopus vulgaris]